MNPHSRPRISLGTRVLLGSAAAALVVVGLLIGFRIFPFAAGTTSASAPSGQPGSVQPGPPRANPGPADGPAGTPTPGGAAPSSTAPSSPADPVCAGLNSGLNASQCRLIGGVPRDYVVPASCVSNEVNLAWNGVVCDPAPGKVKLASGTKVYLNQFAGRQELDVDFQAFYTGQGHKIPTAIGSVTKPTARSTWNYTGVKDPAGELGSLIDRDKGFHLRWSDYAALYSGEIVTTSTPTDTFDWWTKAG